MKDIQQILVEHPFFAGFAPEHGRLIAGCARNHRFDAGSFLLREGEPADTFFLIRHGRVTVEIATPGQQPIVIQTLGPGDIVGASWLVPPYRWMYDALAIELVRAIGIDARCLRDKCEVDHDLGYDMMKRFVPKLVERLQATRLQLLDVYGKK
jgi:CRP/FNR family transcriptional regulator, cyclic AMP receptor protein